MEHKTISIFKQAVNEDNEMLIEAMAQVTVAVYTICEKRVRFDTPLGNISFFAKGHGKWKPDTESCRRKQVRKM